MKSTLLSIAAAAILAASTGADAAAVRHRDDSVSTCARNSWANSNFKNTNAFKNSLASKVAYNAETQPWVSGSTPGWCVGTKSSSLTTWDGGDSKWCSYSPYSETSFCQSGNPSGTKPSSSQNKNPWGSQGGDKNKPCPTQSSSSSSSSSSKSSTSSTSSSSTSTSSTSTSSTSSASAVAATGSAVTTCTDGYSMVFNNYTTTAESGYYEGQVVGAATVDNANYLTYGLSSTAEGCLTVCDGVSGCVFVNSYLAQYPAGEEPTDLSASAAEQYDGSYTCALYAICEGTANNTNYGGQNDPSYITDSSGWCKGC